MMGRMSPGSILGSGPRPGALRLALLALAALGSSGARAAQSDGSLEAFLKRIRTEGEAEHARLRPRIEELARRLGQARTQTELAKIHAEIEDLGGEAHPLLLPYLEPGPTPAPEREQLAREVAAILGRSGSPALLDELVRLARVGGPLGRSLAIRVLGHSPEVERARNALRNLYPELGGSLRAACVQSLARLAPEDPLLIAALGDAHPEVLEAALRALKEEPRKQPRREVVALLEDPTRAGKALAELVDYFSFPGQETSEETVAALLRLAGRADLSPTARLAVLEGMPRFGVGLTSRLRKEMEPLLASSDSAIKDGALVAMTLLKDSRARRELLKVYDDQVKNNDGWPLAYQRRGDIEFRIGEYRDAARDYQNALRLHGNSARLPGNRELWINLARAHVRDNKLKAAYDALSEFGLSTDLRRTLRLDPDFLPLAEHQKYKSLFE